MATNRAITWLTWRRLRAPLTLTSERVAKIRSEMYRNAPDGLCGNEDCGQMSAWYVWSALGMYPVTPGSGELVIGTPLFTKALIQPEGLQKGQLKSWLRN